MKTVTFSGEPEAKWYNKKISLQEKFYCLNDFFSIISSFPLQKKKSKSRKKGERNRCKVQQYYLSISTRIGSCVSILELPISETDLVYKSIWTCLAMENNSESVRIYWRACCDKSQDISMDTTFKQKSKLRCEETGGDKWNRERMRGCLRERERKRERERERERESCSVDYLIQRLRECGPSKSESIFGKHLYTQWLYCTHSETTVKISSCHTHFLGKWVVVVVVVVE